VIRVAVITSVREGFASVCLPLLHSQPGIEVVGVLLSRNELTLQQRRRLRWKQIRKTLAIGPLGAYNGIRMRRWYNEDLNAALNVRPIDELCAKLGISLTEVAGVNRPDTLAALGAMAPDLALSLGNGYIGSKVFRLPRLGMLNIHHELLPEFRGAQSVLWQLYQGNAQTGYTIHTLDSGLDTGAIVHQEAIPIMFCETIGQTVTATVAELFRRSAAELPRVVVEIEDRLRTAKPQEGGKHFTTPSYWQFRRMVRNHDRLAVAAGALPPEK